MSVGDVAEEAFIWWEKQQCLLLSFSFFVNLLLGASLFFSGAIIYSALYLRGEQHVLLKSMSSLCCNQKGVWSWKACTFRTFETSDSVRFTIDSFYIFINKNAAPGFVFPSVFGMLSQSD